MFTRESKTSTQLSTNKTFIKLKITNKIDNKVCNTIILLLFLTYERGTLKKVKRIINESDVKVAMRPVRTIDQIFPSLKDPNNLEEKSCVVYNVPCSDCNFVYIGQTKRDVKSRH